MKSGMKNWLIAAICLIITGCLLFVGGMTMMNWDFTKLATVTMETNEYIFAENYRDIRIKTDVAHIELVLSEKSETAVVCREHADRKHSVGIADGALVIEAEKTGKLYGLGLNFESEKITVYLPECAYGALSVRNSTGGVKIPADFLFESIDISVTTGDIVNLASASDSVKLSANTGGVRIADASMGELDISTTTGYVTVSGVACEGAASVKVSTGRTKLDGLTCKTFSSAGSTGAIELKDVIAREKLSITRSTGDIRFDGCDAGEIFAKTGTGDISGSLLTDKVFFAETDTGRVKLPRTTSGGECELHTGTGDITLEIG